MQVRRERGPCSRRRRRRSRRRRRDASRRVAYVVTGDGVCANTVLVRDGLARVSSRLLTRLRLDELNQAEAEAQRLEKGMWGYTRRPQPNKRRSSWPRSPSSPRRSARSANATSFITVQPLADLDFRLLHRARAADVRSLRARLHARMARGSVRAHRHWHRRPSRKAPGVEPKPSSFGSPKIVRIRCIAASATRSRGAR